MAMIKYSPKNTVEGIAVEITQTVVLTPEIIAEYMRNECGSHEMALFINSMGVMNQKWQSTTCYSTLELTKDGETFIDDLHYFIHDKSDDNSKNV